MYGRVASAFPPLTNF